MRPKVYGDRINQILNYIEEVGETKVVAKLIVNSIFRGRTNEFMSMHQLSMSTRNRLVEKFGSTYTTLRVETSHNDTQATKVLFRCQDNAKIESVSLSFRNHHSLCISSQVGCAFGCAFCATGKLGLIRQLTASEITDQVFHFVSESGTRTSVSFMGMGEPLGNPKLYSALSALTNPIEFGLQAARINVSTIGIIPGILKLNELHPKVNLAYSLHSPFSDQRVQLMPIEKVYPFQEVFKLLDQRITASNNRIWIAYLLLSGVNDSVDHAKALVELIKSRPQSVRYLYHINLLPYNAAKNVSPELTRVNNISTFKNALDAAGISNSYRNSFGRTIDAACGQLYAEYQAKSIRVEQTSN